MFKKFASKSALVITLTIMLLLAIAPATVFAADDTVLLTSYAQAVTRNKQITAWAYSNLNAQDSYAHVRINALKKQGKDVSVLEAALSNYHFSFDAALALNAEATALLDLHEGMGLSGNVMDAVKLKNSIQDANNAMTKSENLIRSANSALHSIVKQY